MNPETQRWVQSLPLLMVSSGLAAVGGVAAWKAGNSVASTAALTVAALLMGAWLVRTIVDWAREWVRPADDSAPHQYPDSEPDPESEA